MPVTPYDALADQMAAGTQAPATPTPYEETLRAMRQEREAALRTVLGQASTQSPDRAAQVRQLADRLGLPAPVVERNFEEAQRRAATSDPVRGTLLDETPVLGEWLTDPSNAAVAQDDIPTLQALEHTLTFWGALRRYWHMTQQMGYAAVEAVGEAGEAESLAGWGGTGRREQAAIVQAFPASQQLAEVRSFEDFAQWMKETVGELIPMLGPSVAGSIGGAAIGSVVPVIGTTLGGVIGAFVPALVMGVGEAQISVKERGEDKTAPGAVFAGGAAIAVLDTALPGKIGGRLVRTFGREAAEEIAAQVLATPVKRAWVRSIAGGTGKALATEGVTEAIQEAIEDVAAAWGTGTAVSPNIWREMFEAGAKGAVIGAGAGAVETAIEVPVENARAARALQAQQFFEVLGQGAAASKTIQRLPEAAQAFLERATQGGPIQDLYVDADTFQTYWQTKNVDPVDIAEHLGIDRRAYQHELASGGQIKIPTARYAVAVAGTEHHQFFAQEMRLGPAEMNAREAEELAAQLETQAVEQVAEDPLTESRQAVRQTIYDMLIAAQTPPDVASAYADLWGVAIGRQAERIGIDPMELLRSRDLRIERPGLGEMTSAERAGVGTETIPAAAEGAETAATAEPAQAVLGNMLPLTLEQRVPGTEQVLADFERRSLVEEIDEIDDRIASASRRVEADWALSSPAERAERGTGESLTEWVRAEQGGEEQRLMARRQELQGRLDELERSGVAFPGMTPLQIEESLPSDEAIERFRRLPRRPLTPEQAEHADAAKQMTDRELADELRALREAGEPTVRLRMLQEEYYFRQQARGRYRTEETYEQDILLRREDGAADRASGAVQPGPGRTPQRPRFGGNLWSYTEDAPEHNRLVAWHLARSGQIPPSLTIEGTAEGIDFITPEGRRIRGFVEDLGATLPDDAVESLLESFREQGASSYEFEGGRYPLPQDRAAWDELPDRHRAAFATSFRPAGYYDPDSDTIHIDQEVFTDPKTWSEEIFHAGVRRLTLRERLAHGIVDTQSEERAFREDVRLSPEVYDRQTAIQTRRAAALQSLLDAIENERTLELVGVGSGARPSTALQGSPGPQARAPSGARAVGGRIPGAADQIPSVQERESDRHFAVRVRPGDITRSEEGVNRARGLVTRATGTGKKVTILYPRRSFADFGTEIHDQQSVDRWLQILDRADPEERARQVRLLTGTNKLENQPLMNLSMGCGRDAAILAAVDDGVLPPEAARDMVSCHGACYKNFDSAALAGGSPVSSLLRASRIDLENGRRNSPALRELRAFAQRFGITLTNEMIPALRNKEGKRQKDHPAIDEIKNRFAALELGKKVKVWQELLAKGWADPWVPQEATNPIAATREDVEQFLDSLRDATVRRTLSSPAPFIRGNQQGDWLNDIVTGAWQAMVRGLMARGITPPNGKKFSAVTAAWYVDVPFALLKEIAGEFGPGGANALVLQVTGPIDFPFWEATLRLKGYEKLRQAGLVPVMRLITDEFGQGGTDLNDPRSLAATLRYIVEGGLSPADVLETPLHIDAPGFLAQKPTRENIDKLTGRVQRMLFDVPTEEAERRARAVLERNRIFHRHGPKGKKLQPWGHAEVGLTYRRLWDLGVIDAALEARLKAAGFLYRFKRGEGREEVEGVFPARCCTTGKCLTCGPKCQAKVKAEDRRALPGEVTESTRKVIALIDASSAAVLTQESRRRYSVQEKERLHGEIIALDRELSHPFGDRDDFSALLETATEDLSLADLEAVRSMLLEVKDRRATLAPWQMTREDWRQATRQGRWQIVGSRVRGEATEASDTDMLTVLTPDEDEAFARKASAVPAEIVERWRKIGRGKAKQADIFFVSTRGGGRRLWTLEGPPSRPRPRVVVGAHLGLAGGWPKGEYPRPVYQVEGKPDHWVVRETTARGEAREVGRFDTEEAADAEARRRNDALAGIALSLHDEAWTPEAAADYAHERSVRRAVAEGRPVPAEVIAEYPDLRVMDEAAGPGESRTYNQSAPPVRRTETPEFRAREALATIEQHGYEVSSWNDVKGWLLDRVSVSDRTRSYGGGRVTASAARAPATVRRALAVLNETPPDVVEQALNADTRYQGEEEGIVQGSLTLGPARRAVIKLLPQANLGTFLHETGHFFIEQFGELAHVVGLMAEDQRTPEQQQLYEDYQTLLRFVGAKDRDSLTIEHHETFARAFEAYLMEGKPPSLALGKVFARFRTWLVAIYRTLKGLRVEMSDEVRQVFDRMLASEQAIEEAAAAGKLDALLTPELARQAGVSEQEFGRYAERVQDARERAKQTLERRLLTEVHREQQAAWKAQREEVRGEVASEMGEQPAYKALFAMQRGPKDDEGRQHPPLRLSKQILVDRYGKDRLARLPRPHIYTIEGGLDPDVVAEQFGFSSGDEMLLALEGLEPFTRAVERETDRRMLERHGTLLLDTALHNAAQQALASEDQEQIIEAELRALAQIVRLAREGAKEEAEAPERRPGPREEARQAAAAERRAGREALSEERRERAYERRWLEAEIKLKVAIAEGRKQVEIDALRREAQALKAKARRGPAYIRAAVPPLKAIRAAARRHVAQMRIRELAPERYWVAARKASEKAIEAAAAQNFEQAIIEKQRQLYNLSLYREATAVLDDIESRVEQARDLTKPKARERIGRAGESYLEQIDQLLDLFEVARATNKALARRQRLRDWVTEREAEGLPVDIPEALLEQSQQVNYRELRVEEFLGLSDALRHIVHLARLKNRLLRAQEQRELDEIVANLAASIRDHAHRQRPPSLEPRLPGAESWRRLEMFFASHRKLASLAREMDGFEDGGPAWEYLIRPLNEAADREAGLNAEATRKLQAIVDAAYRPAERPALYVKRFIPAIGASLSKMGTLMVALHWGNEQNRQRILSGYKWDERQVAAILQTLDARDWQFVEGVWDLLDSYWPEIAAKQQRVTGVAPEKVEASPFETPYGTVRGGYFPLKYESRIEARASAFEGAEAAHLAKAAAYAHATTKRGHTKAREEKVTMPPRLDFGVIFEHLAQVIHDLTHHEALIDVGRVLGHKTVQQAIYDTHGEVVFDQFRQGVRDIAVGDVPAKNAFEAALNHIRVGSTVAMMGWSFFTATLQPLGLTQSVQRVGARWIAVGLSRWMRDAAHMENTVRWITERSAFMRNRFRTQQREIAEIRNTVGLTTGRFSGWIDRALRGLTADTLTKQAVVDSYFWMIGVLQRVADVPTWIGAYEKAMAGGETEERAVALADQAVLDSQGGGQMKDLAAVQRGGPALKLWTNFYSFFNVTFNLATEARRSKRLSNPLDIGRLAADYLLLFIAPACLSYALYGLLGRNPEDEDPLEGLVRENLSYIAGILLGLREVSGVIQGFAGYEGPAGARFFASLGRAAKQTEQAIREGETDAAFWRTWLETTGVLFHYPAAQLRRSLEGLVQLVEGQTENPTVLLTGPRKDEED